MEVVEDLAHPLSSTIVAELLGLPMEGSARSERVLTMALAQISGQEACMQQRWETFVADSERTGESGMCPQTCLHIGDGLLGLATVDGMDAQCARRSNILLVII
jgi:hypothetical protein